MNLIYELQKEAYETAIEKGFEFPTNIGEVNMTLARLMLVVTELGEATQAVRNQDMPAFVNGLADACVHIFGTAYAMHIDLGGEIPVVMAANKLRPHMHGGKVI